MDMRDLSDLSIRDLSVLLEHWTGLDSIPTIERVYEREGESYVCSMPDCTFRRVNPEMLWRHLHFGPKHPLSFRGFRDTDGKLYQLQMLELGDDDISAA